MRDPKYVFTHKSLPSVLLRITSLSVKLEGEGIQLLHKYNKSE